MSDGPFHVRVFAHRNSEVFFPWEHSGEAFSEETHNSIHYMGYEVEMIYVVNPESGKTRLRYIRADERWFPEPPSKEVLQEAQENGE